MSIEIKVPELGESVSEATVAQWLKKEGEAIQRDEPLVELETDKVTLEVNAEADGVLSKITAKAGEDVKVGAVLGLLEAGGTPAKEAPKAEEKKEGSKEEAKSTPKKEEKPEAESAPKSADKSAESDQAPSLDLSPAVAVLIEEYGLDAGKISGSGKDGRILKGDVLDFVAQHPDAVGQAASGGHAGGKAAAQEPREERVPMSRLRRRIAQRLKEAQNTAALLTTFNDVDMSTVMALRAQYKESFQKQHGVGLGFMSFFVKAAVEALKEIPAVNAEIDGDEIIYKNYYDISVAVSTPNGLVVPVLRDCDTRSFAEIEQGIVDLATRGREGKLSMEDLQGGTFSITNGGIFGSLLSTPIINPPQVAILGMHRIEERPVVIKGEITARPMMYLALSYDHRIIDGREAVTFLRRIKDGLEDPQRLLLQV